jgi:hypothetical protein
MRQIYPIVILFLLIAASSAQLAPDKERFDVVLHPGDLEERTLKTYSWTCPKKNCSCLRIKQR